MVAATDTLSPTVPEYPHRCHYLKTVFLHHENMLPISAPLILLFSLHTSTADILGLVGVSPG
jgi:hypothetical protein